MGRKSPVDVLSASVPPFSASEKSISVNVRKIDNGYIKRTCKSSENSYECCEEFSAQEPELDAQPRATPATSLRDAVNSLK